MTALAMDVRELSFDEVDNVSGGPATGAVVVAVAVGVGIGIVVVALEDTVKGFVDGMFAGFNNGK